MVWWLVADLAVGMGNVCKDFGFCWGCVVGGLVVGYIEVVVVGVLVGRCVWLLVCGWFHVVVLWLAVVGGVLGVLGGGVVHQVFFWGCLYLDLYSSYYKIQCLAQSYCQFYEN